MLIGLAAVFLAAPVLVGRREVGLYGSIVDFNRRLANIAVLRSMPAIRVTAAAAWDEPSVVGTPPPTVRVIGPDGRPIDEGGYARTSGPATGGKAPALGRREAGVISVSSTPYRPSGQSGGWQTSGSASPGTARSGDSSYALTPRAGRPAASTPAQQRRKLIFESLLGAFGATFVVGLLPGLRAVLLLSLVLAVLLVAYAAMLRQFKLQSSLMKNAANTPGSAVAPANRPVAANRHGEGGGAGPDAPA